MDSDRAPSPSRGLGTVLRVVTAGAGAILAAAGAAAVFLTDNGVGSGVLIAAGVLFGLIGIGGRLPSSIKLGDNEITMPIVEAVSRRIESASPEEASELVPNVVAALPGSDRLNIESYAAGQIYADKVALALRLAVAESGANYTIDRPTRDGGVDFELHGAKTIGIIVRYSQAHNPIAARKTVEGLCSSSTRSRVRRLSPGRQYVWHYPPSWADSPDSVVKEHAHSCGFRGRRTRRKVQRTIGRLTCR